MKEIGRIILPILLATTVILGLTPQTQAPIGPTATLTLEPPVVSVVPCSEFTIEIWLRDITPNYGVTHMYGYGYWDPNQVTPVEGGVFNLSPAGWMSSLVEVGPGIVECEAWPEEGGKPITGDFMVGFVKLHCKSEGVSTIMIKYTLTLMSITAIPDGQTPPTVDVLGEDSVDVHQVPRVPPSYSTPVGGILTSVNKLVVLAPYLALMGLVGAVSTYALKRRRRA